MHLALEPIPKILFYCAGAFRFMSENLVLATAMIDDGAISVVAEVINSVQRPIHISHSYALQTSFYVLLGHSLLHPLIISNSLSTYPHSTLH